MYTFHRIDLSSFMVQESLFKYKRRNRKSTNIMVCTHIISLVCKHINLLSLQKTHVIAYKAYVVVMVVKCLKKMLWTFWYKNQQIKISIAIKKKSS